ncbi:hypothetical protein HF072_05735 [Bacillus sp. RO3]|nr:hypothetical protein [Bacillus sp. RO3]
MPTWIRCDHKLSWFLVFKALMIYKRNTIHCPHCHHVLYLTPKSKRMLVGFTAFIPLSFVLLYILQRSMLSITIWIVLVTLLLVFAPYFVAFTNAEEPMF